MRVSLVLGLVASNSRITRTIDKESRVSRTHVYAGCQSNRMSGRTTFISEGRYRQEQHQRNSRQSLDAHERDALNLQNVLVIGEQ
jgi:hypothetical protein